MVYNVPTFDLGEALGQGLGAGIGGTMQQLTQNKMQDQQQQRKTAQLQNLLSNASLEDLKDPLKRNILLAAFPDLAKNLGQEFVERDKIAAKPPAGGPTAQPTPPHIANAIKQALARNPNATADELQVNMDELGIPRIYSNSFTENRRRDQEGKEKSQGKIAAETRKELVPIKQEIAQKAAAAQRGIENKENLFNLINKGNLNDPTFATLLEQLPFKLGKRILSNDTVQYKAGLVDEYTDLRNIFQGQTRVKELDILEEKLADIYLDDEQKKAVLKSRINALNIDLIRAEAAAEVEQEHPELGILQFEQAVSKKMKPKMKELSDRFIDEQKSIIKTAEERKKFTLNPDNPEDRQIAMQILQEAGGDKRKAEQIAKKKGYKINL